MLGRVNLLKRTLICGSILIVMFGLLQFVSVKNAHADEIKLNTTYNVKFTESEDAVLTFKAPKKGYFWAEITLISCINARNNEDVSSFNTADYKISANYRDYDEDSGMRVGNGVCKTDEYCFKPNTKVTLRLSDGYGSYDNPLWTARVNVKTKCPSRFETEGNNSKSKADKLKLKKTFSGVRNYKDNDYWCFKAPKKGKYKFKYVCTKGEEFEISFIKKSKVISHSYSELGEGWNKFSVKLKKGQKIYLKIYRDSYWSNNYSKYKIKVTRK